MFRDYLFPAESGSFNIMAGVCIAIVAVTLTAGCIGPDYVANHDILVIKHASDGKVEWITPIDTGSDEFGHDIIQMPDQILIISASVETIPNLSDSGGKSTGSHTFIYNEELFGLTREGKILWKLPLSKYGCGFFNPLNNWDNFIFTLSKEGKICKFNSHGEMVWNRSTTLIGSESLLVPADGGFEIKGTNMTLVPRTYEELANESSPEVMAILSRQCAGSSPDTNVSCNWGYRPAYTKFSAKLDTDGNVLNYTRSGIADTYAEISNAGRNSGTETGIILSFKREDAKKYNVTSKDGLISVPYAIKKSPNGSIVWESRINIFETKDYVNNPGSFTIDRVIPSLDNGYVILASIDNS